MILFCVSEDICMLKKAEQSAGSGAITKDFIDTFIDRIYVTPQDDGSMRLDIKIFTGDSTEKYLTKLKRRSRALRQSLAEEEKSGESKRNSEKSGENESAESSGPTGHTFKKMIEAYENGLK